MLILSAGPTSMAENTLQAMAVQRWNADLSRGFYQQYERVVAKYDRLIGNSSGYSFIMGAEAMIALEGACASLMEKGDRVLVLANGIFGRGFAELVSMYGAEPIMVYQPDETGFSLEAVKTALVENKDIKLATMIHCETPTGVTNPVKEICLYLKEQGILSIVDSVSAIGGEELNFDQSGIDVLLGGSQKCLSGPSGLGFVTLSKGAILKIKERQSPIPSYYANYQYFLNWQEKMWFPYTMPEQLINAMEAALDNILEEAYLEKHARYAALTRQVLLDNQVELFAKSHASNTLTAFYAPKSHLPVEILRELENKHNILISGSLAEYQSSLLRIGHMGENNQLEYFERLFYAMDQVWQSLGIADSHFLDSFYRFR